MNNQQLQTLDNEHVWHPYSSAHSPLSNYLVSHAEGVHLHLADGRVLVDGMSSWWAVIHGYNHPILNQAIKTQLENMAHVMFGGLTHKPAITLAKKLIDIVPTGLTQVFFCDSGSVAVEVAMKMALQYQQAKGQKSKTSFATVTKGYHGDTWHTMSVCDPVTGMHHIFNDKLACQHFVPNPRSVFSGEFDLADLQPIQTLFAEKHGEIAAFILEPIVQGAGGMWFYHPQFLSELKRLCEQYEILLIADEIATGFGRSGKLFACEYANISPDILCLGKAISGGYLSFAATLCTEAIAECISTGKPSVFMHGPTFMANPLACAVANASIDLLLESDWQANIQRIEQHFNTHLSPLVELETVYSVRVLGAIGVVELLKPVDMATIQSAFVDAGVWVRPFGKLVYLMPPFIISDGELLQLTEAVATVVKSL